MRCSSLRVPSNLLSMCMLCQWKTCAIKNFWRDFEPSLSHRDLAL